MVNRTGLTFEAIAIDGDDGWASNYEYNGLYQVNMKTGACEYLGVFPEEASNKKRIHCCAKKLQNKVYFIPAAGNVISVLNIDDKSMESLKIPCPENGKYAFYKPAYKFIEAVVSQSCLWIVPSTYPGVLRLDSDTSEIKVYDQWIPDTGYMFRKGLCIEGKRFLIPSGSNNNVLMFDMEMETGTILCVGIHNHGSMSMCSYDGKYWLAPRVEGAVVMWDPNTNLVKEYTEYPDIFKCSGIVFSKNYVFNGQIIFAPAKANTGIVISENAVKTDRSNCWKEETESNVEFLFETEEYLYFREVYRDRHQKRFFRVSKSTNEQTDYCFFVPDADSRKQEVILSAMCREEIIKESKKLGLGDLMNCLINGRDNI